MNKYLRWWGSVGYREKIRTVMILFLAIAGAIWVWFELIPYSIRPDIFSYSFSEFVLVPLFFVSAALSLASLILYFRPEATFRRWWKFARIYIPACLIFFLLFASDGGGWAIPSFTPPDGVAMFFSAIFLIVTLGIVVSNPTDRV